MTDASQIPPHHFPYKNAFLGFVLALLAANVAILVTEGDYSYRKYVGIVVTLMLLFNHIAFQYKMPGSSGALTKMLAWMWLCIGMLYIGTVVFC